MPKVDSFNSAIIGHLSIDINVDHDGHTVTEVGGAVIASACAAASLEHKVAAIAVVGEENREALECFPQSVAEVFWVPSTKTTSIQNVYSTADRERRISTALAQGDSISIQQMPKFEAKILHLAGLIIGDFDPNLVEDLSSQAMVAVDMQAFLRHRNPDSGQMYFEDYVDKRQLFTHTHFLKVDTAEAEVLTGMSDENGRSDRIVMAKKLQSWGANEVMLSNSEEILICVDQDIYICPLRARSLVGRTGRGDTVFAAYINERLNRDISAALLTSCAAVSLKMETLGPLITDRQTVLDYQHEFYGDLEGESLKVHDVNESGEVTQKSSLCGQATRSLRGVPGSTRITELSLPGTHDTMTASCEERYYHTQTWTLPQQLENGVRFVDLRLTRNMVAAHREWVSDISFDEILEDLRHFLQENPSEFVIARIQNANEAKDDYLQYRAALWPHIERNRDLFWSVPDPTNTVWPTVEEVRGKIVALECSPPEFHVSTLAGSNWAANWHENPQVVIQDLWDGPTVGAKVTAIKEALSPKNADEKLILNHVSASNGELKYPDAYAAELNGRMRDLHNDQPWRGVQIYDFVDCNLVDLSWPPAK